MTIGMVMIGMAWIKGDGWLQRLGFKDSTGASVVYMCGGVCGFVGNLMLGPRFSIFSKTASGVKKNSYQMQKIIERRQRRDMRNEFEALTIPGMTAGRSNLLSQHYDPTMRSSASMMSMEKQSTQHGVLPEPDLAARPFGMRAESMKPASAAPSFY